MLRKGIDMSSAVIGVDYRIDVGERSKLDHYQRTAEKILTLLEEENKILNEKMKLFKKENSRDRKRKLFELYDQHYKKIMFGVGGVALAAVIAAGSSAYVTFAHQPQMGQHLTTAQMFALLSGPVTSALLAGSGLVNLLVRAGYFMDCNGKFQEMRRGRDAVKQALVQIEDYERTEQLRHINYQISALSPEKFRLREKWKIRRLKGDINRREKQIKRYVKKMDKRDNQTLNKEKKDVGGKPSYVLMSVEAKKIAKRKLDELGIGAYAGFFIDPEGELQVEKQTWRQRALKSTKSIRKKIFDKMQKSSSPKPITAREQLQQTCERMRNELKEGPGFSSLFHLTQQEVAQTRYLLDNIAR